MIAKRFRISTRIYVGFGLLISLAVGIAVFATIKSQDMGRQAEAMDGNTKNLVRVLDISRLLEVLRTSELQYKADMRAEALHQQEQTESRMAVLAEAARSTTTSDERRPIYQAMLDVLRSHHDSFKHYVQLRQSAEAMRAGSVSKLAAAMVTSSAELLEAARAAGDLATTARAARVESSVMLLRIAFLRFNSEVSQPNVDAFLDASKVLGSAVTALEDGASPALKERITALRGILIAYQAGFVISADQRLKAVALFDGDLQAQLTAISQQTDLLRANLMSVFEANGLESERINSSSQTFLEILAAGGLLAGVILGTVIGRGIVGPLRGMTVVMKRLAGGETSLDIPGRAGTDEIGDMARAVEVFRQQALTNLEMTGEREREQVLKDRRQKALDDHIQDFGSSISGVMDGFTLAASRMRAAASEVSDGSRRTRASMTATNAGAVSSAQDLATVAASVDEMSGSIREISQQVVHVTEAVRTAVERAGETNTKVIGLGEAAERIGDVVRLITDIAGQTNLLALNATIEAARAGEAGRGFAVVAGEVKALAAQTAGATQQIASQVLAIRDATGAAIGAVQEVTAAIGQVESVATAIAAAVEEQAAATNQITANVQTVAASTATAAQAMGEVLGIAESTHAASSVALAAAEEVGRTAQALSVEVSDFLAALSKGTETERRRYERTPVQGAMATLRFAGQPGQSVAIRDISRGGLAVTYRGPEGAGTDVEIDMPGGSQLRARIARRVGDMVGLSFRQDDASLRAIEAEMQRLSGAVGRAA